MGNLQAYALPTPGAGTYLQCLKIPICRLSIGEEALESRSISVFWKIGRHFCVVVFENLQVLDSDDFVLAFDEHPIDSVAVVPHQGSLQCPWCQFLRFL